MSKIREKGFTLSEVMIASLILATTLLFILGLFRNIDVLSQINNNLTTAILHCQSIMEKFKNENFSQLELAITNNAWDLKTTALSNAPYNFSVLTNESIDTKVIQSGDPLGISVEVRWNDFGQRTRSFELQTLLTD